MLEPTRFTRKTFSVDAMQVTAKNIFEIAEWCEGFVKRSEFDGVLKTYVEVPVTVKNGVKRDKAFVGDWVTRTERSFKAYRNEAFKIAFEPNSSHPGIRHDGVHLLVREAMFHASRIATDNMIPSSVVAVQITNKIVEIFEGEMG